VSATSSNANVAPTADTGAPTDEAVVFGAEESAVAAGVSLGEQGNGQEDEHSSTQLVYGDPEAQGVKAQIISRMAGEGAAGKMQPVGDAHGVTAGGRSLRRR
jgi:hypothetical protein